MSELAFLGIILGANAGLIAFAAWIVGDERAEAYARLGRLDPRHDAKQLYRGPRSTPLIAGAVARGRTPSTRA